MFPRRYLAGQKACYGIHSCGIDRYGNGPAIRLLLNQMPLGVDYTPQVLPLNCPELLKEHIQSQQSP